ncbi:TPA: DUF551 domain-containing protein [Salmonella enterica subsp. salamae serovar 1,4,12,[27]:b:[e,n,x]]|uniref:DUF551 domain-containing protein n=1 Tax=Salmonella enterica TaxID=28901 RepID=UPI00201679E5|nr:DUF551 domain-containing protein [Salmonella enterica]
MTTITKEWLQQTIAEFENTRDDIPFGLSDDDAKILIVLKRALASLEAEPVGYFYADKPGDWYQISDGDRVPDHRRIPLYSSPQPAQVVKLPNEFISNEGIVVQIEKVMAVLAVHGIQYKRRGNACSAAMLQAGNHTEQHLDMVDHSGDANEKGSDGTFIDEGTKQAGNSPVIPDGWISCSERMPDNDESKPIAIFTGKCLGQGIFVATYDDDGFFDYWEGMEIIGVTHWMPLPEPPQK